MAFEASALRPAGSTAAVIFFCLLAGAGSLWTTLPSAAPFRRGNPSTTALIEARAEEAREQGRAARRNQHWVPLTRISPWLQLAVVHSEDARFLGTTGTNSKRRRTPLRPPATKATFNAARRP